MEKVRLPQHHLRLYKITGLLFFLSCFLISSSLWIFAYFGKLNIDQVIFHVTQPMAEANMSPLYSYLACSLLPSLILTWLAFEFMYLPRPQRKSRADKSDATSVTDPESNSTASTVSTGEDSTRSLVYISESELELSRSIEQINNFFVAKEPLRSNYPVRHFLLRHQIIVIIAFLLSALIVLSSIFSLPEYLYSTYNQSPLLEEKYVEPRDVKITFPQNKRNLIYIFLESMESSYTSWENGGLAEKNFIPKLTDLALSENNVHFSDKRLLGGARQVDPVSWTVAGMVSQSGGIPLKTPLRSNEYGARQAKFLPGLYNLGDILQEQGYNLELIFGSNARFANRDKFYSQHGDYRILDLLGMRRENFVDSKYDNGFWGVEDEKMFKIAKQELLKAAADDKPFAFTLLTVDTHFPNGYLYDGFPKPFDNSYANAIYCSDTRVYDFVHWVQEQDFYPDTTIIISGDHLTMAHQFVSTKLSDTGRGRTVYNCIINPSVDLNYDADSRLHNRLFSTMDFFPTTLAAMGVQIEGDKLAYGTNLFSEKQTLPEEIGFKEFQEIMEGYSSFYKRKFFKTPR